MKTLQFYYLNGNTILNSGAFTSVPDNSNSIIGSILIGCMNKSFNNKCNDAFNVKLGD